MKMLEETLIGSIHTHDLPTTLTLLEAGAPVGPVSDGSGLTPLHHAIQTNNAIATFYLLLAGAENSIDLSDLDNSVAYTAVLFKRKWFLPLYEATMELKEAFVDWLCLVLHSA